MDDAHAARSCRGRGGRRPPAAGSRSGARSKGVISNSRNLRRFLWVVSRGAVTTVPWPRISTNGLFFGAAARAGNARTTRPARTAPRTRSDEGLLHPGIIADELREPSAFRGLTRPAARALSLRLRLNLNPDWKREGRVGLRGMRQAGRIGGGAGARGARQRGRQLMLLAAVLALAARLSYEPTLATAERRVEVMGTTLDLVVRMKYRDEALAASEAALAEIRRVEALLTTWKPGGELWRVDEGAPGKPVAVSSELARAARDRLRLGAAHAGRLRPDRASPHPRLGPARQGPHPDAGRARRRAQGLGRRSLPHRRRGGIRDAPLGRRRHRRGRLGQGLRARARRSRAPESRRRRRGPRPRRPGARGRQRRERAAVARPGRGPAGSAEDRGRARPDEPLGFDLGQLRARPRRGRPPDRPHPRSAHRRARRGLRLGHGRRALGARRRHPLDGLLRARPRKGPRALGGPPQGRRRERSALSRRPRRRSSRPSRAPASPASFSRPTPVRWSASRPNNLNFRREIPCFAYPVPWLSSSSRSAPPRSRRRRLRPRPRPRPRRCRQEERLRQLEQLLADTRAELAKIKAVFDRRDDRRAARRAFAPHRHPRPGNPEHEDGRGGARPRGRRAVGRAVRRALRHRPRRRQDLRHQAGRLDRRLRRGALQQLRLEGPERQPDLGRRRHHAAARGHVPRLQVRQPLRAEHGDRVRERGRRLGQGRRGGGRVRLHRLHALGRVQRARPASSSSRRASSTSSTSRRRFSAPAGRTSKTSSSRRRGASSAPAPTGRSARFPTRPTASTA